MSFNVTGSLWTATKMPETSNNTRRERWWTWVQRWFLLSSGDPCRQSHSRGRNQYRGSRVIELSDSFNKKKENKRRERRTKMMIFSFIRFVAACLLCSSQRKKKEGNEPNLHQINTSNGRKCRIERDKDLLLFLFSLYIYIYICSSYSFPFINFPAQSPGPTSSIGAPRPQCRIIPSTTFSKWVGGDEGI